MCWKRIWRREKKETNWREKERRMIGHSKLRGQQLKITPGTFEQPWANDNRSKLKLRQTRSHGTSKAAINCYGTTTSNSDKFAGITFFDKRKPSEGRGKLLKYAPVSRYRGASFSDKNDPFFRKRNNWRKVRGDPPFSSVRNSITTIDSKTSGMTAKLLETNASINNDLLIYLSFTEH